MLFAYLLAQWFLQQANNKRLYGFDAGSILLDTEVGNELDKNKKIKNKKLVNDGKTEKERTLDRLFNNFNSDKENKHKQYEELKKILKQLRNDDEARRKVTSVAIQI